MIGKVFVVATVVLGAFVGGLMYWLQVYAFYDEVTPARIVVTSGAGRLAPLPATAVEAIDATSSPIRFRACFDTTTDPAALDAQPYPDAEPLTGPGWFDCYDAREVGEALEAGTARAFLGEKNVHYGVDRVVAILPDGRGVIWHQLNDCGDLGYDGTPVGEACPERPAPAATAEGA